MLQQFLGQPHIEGLYWSLEVELVFYLVCVLMHSMGLLSKPGPLFIACIVFFLIFAVGQTASHKIMFISKLNENLLTRQLLYMPYLLSIMFVGSLYRKIFDYKENKSPKNIKFTSIFATLVCFGFPAMVLILSLFGINLNSSDSVKFGLSHLFALMIFAAGFVIFNKKAGLLAWFGKISYSLYLFQASAMVFLGYLVAKYHSLGGFHLGVYMSATFILSIGISAAVYYLIEKPAIDAGHRLTKKILTESKIQPEIVASTVQ